MSEEVQWVSEKPIPADIEPVNINSVDYNNKDTFDWLICFMHAGACFPQRWLGV